MAGIEARSTATEKRRNHKMTVLVVEDEELVCEVTCDVLEHSGYRVLRARSAAEARELVAELKGSIDLLFCDAILPDENGVALSQALQEAFPEMRVVLTSAYPARALAGACGRNIKTQFLTKPYSAASLISKLRIMLPATQRGEGHQIGGR